MSSEMAALIISVAFMLAMSMLLVISIEPENQQPEDIGIQIESLKEKIQELDQQLHLRRFNENRNP